MAMARALVLFQVLWIACALSVEIPYESTAELGDPNFAATQISVPPYLCHK